MYPVGFKGSLDETRFGYERVDYDMVKPPRFDFEPSREAVHTLFEEAADEPAMRDEMRRWLETEAILLQIEFPAVELRLFKHYDDEAAVVVHGSVSGLCQVTSTARGIHIELSTLEIHCEDHAIDEKVLREVADKLLPGINAFLKGVTLPAVEVPGARLSPPVVSLTSQILLAAFARESHGAPVPPSALPSAPKGKQFLGLSQPLIEAAATEIFKTYKADDKAETDLAGVHFWAEYWLGIKNPKATFEGQNQISFALDAYGAGKVGAKKWKLTASMGLSITASPRATGTVRVDAHDVVQVTLNRVDDFKVQIDLDHVPKWLNWATSQIISWLAKPIAKLIGSSLSGLTIPVSRINPVSIPVSGLKQVVVSFSQVDLVIGTADKPLLVGEGYAKVEPAAIPGRIGKAEIDHVVVVMMENRSFDNLVGWLYRGGQEQPLGNIPPADPPTYNGLDKGKYWNDYKGERYYATESAESFTVPTPDPQEQFRYMNQQIFGTMTPEEGQEATMEGFVLDYATVKKNKEPQSIMQCYSPEQVPVLAALARNYAICDRWFGSVPCQTWPNRAFAHVGTSCGRVNNLDKDEDDDYSIPDPKYYAGAKTLLNYLQEIGVSWKVYSEAQDHLPVPSLTRLQFLFRVGDRQFDPNFQNFSQFKKDAASGTLPAYSFVEPNFFADDFHPPHSVQDGDRFLHDAWEAVSKGKNWKTTLLIITFDEHGGCYDHVPPPWTAVKPDESKPQKPFGFNRYGVRVPTILVSPFVEPGTVFRSGKSENEYDHTSILRTIRDWVDPDGKYASRMPPSKRIPVAPSLAPVLTRSAPRDDTPVIAAPEPLAEESVLDAPLNPIQRSLLVGALTSSGKKLEEIERLRRTIQTRMQALEFLTTARLEKS
jgi:phospholipase C